MKNFQQFSRESSNPAPFTSFLTPAMTFSTSSSGKSSGISPEASRSLTKTRNFSSGTWSTTNSLIAAAEHSYTVDGSVVVITRNNKKIKHTRSGFAIDGFACSMKRSHTPYWKIVLVTRTWPVVFSKTMLPTCASVSRNIVPIPFKPAFR